MEDEAVSRRRFLAVAARGVTLAAVGGGLWPALGHGQKTEAASSERSGLITRVTRPYDAETSVQALQSWITPNDHFFVRSHFGVPQPDAVDPTRWRLSISGMVERPLTLTLDELRRMGSVTVTAVVQCSGNGRAFYRPRVPGAQWERGAVGNAQWTGVRFAEVLSRAGVKEGAGHVQLLGADRPVLPQTPLFRRSIPLEKAVHADTLLAYEMNGAPLPLLHGAPLRLIAPGWMADACVKWLSEITLLEHEATGFYMEKAYRYHTQSAKSGQPGYPADGEPVTDMVVKSLITAPQDSAEIGPRTQMIQGVAWTGEGRRVTVVEVSADGGASWIPAQLIGEPLPYAWRQWQIAWQPPGPGAYVLRCRATDSAGHVQPVEPPWNPGGYLWNGVDRVSVQVGRG